MSEKKSFKNRSRIDPDQRIAYRFSLMSAWQTRCLAGMYVRKFGVSVNGWWVLAVIGRLGRTSATNVVANTTLEPDKITRTVDALVEKGFVLRGEDADDRRRIVLSLTPSGRKAVDEIEKVRRIIEYELLDVLDSAELASFYSILDKLETRGREILVGPGAWRDLVAAHEKATSGKAGAAAPVKPAVRRRAPAKSR